MSDLIVLVIAMLAVVYVVYLVVTNTTTHRLPFPVERDWGDRFTKQRKTMYSSDSEDAYAREVVKFHAPTLVATKAHDKNVWLRIGSHDNVVIPVTYESHAMALYGIVVPIEEYYLEADIGFKIGSQTFNDLRIVKKTIEAMRKQSSVVGATGQLVETLTQNVTLLVRTQKTVSGASFKYTGKFTYVRNVRVTFKGSTWNLAEIDSVVTRCSLV